MLTLFRRQRTQAGPLNSANPEAGVGETIRRPWVVHPFLVGAFPIVSLYAHNIYETPIELLFVPLAIVMTATLVSWLVLRLLSRDALWAGLATSMLVAGFFGYSSLSFLIDEAVFRLTGLWVVRVVHVPPLVVTALTVIAISAILRGVFWRSPHLGLWTSRLNLFTAILIALPTISAASARFREPPAFQREKALPKLDSQAGWKPDIYFIVLDSYARTDVMKDLFDFDNEPFLGRLEKRGFFVARQSTSNYCQTRLSLGSTLNGEYLNKLLDPKSRDQLPITDLIKENLVTKLLRPRGYKFVSCATGFEPTDHQDNDLYLTPNKQIPEFHRLLLEMTPMTPVTPLFCKVDLIDRFKQMRDRTLFLLSRVPSVAEIKQPTFTFAHIVSPHPPFIFGENGEDVAPRQPFWGNGIPRPLAASFGTPEYVRDAYRKQSVFITAKVEQMIDQILANSPEPPVIILQSDHGSGLNYHPNNLELTDLRERFGILNCIFIPDHKIQGLNDRMTSVNTFRVVLRNMMGADLPDLEERSYFSTFDDPLDFTDVTERLHSEQERKRRFTHPPSYMGLLQQF
jgi:hypothetical protein